MYNENYFKKHILWIRIKRLLFVLIFSIIGCIIGVISSSYIVDILLFDWNLKPLIIACSTVIFFFISVFVTSNSSRYVQDCLWKIETLHTLNNLSNKLDEIKILEQSSDEISKQFSTIKNDFILDNMNNIEITDINSINGKNKNTDTCKTNTSNKNKPNSNKNHSSNKSNSKNRKKRKNKKKK